MRPRIASVAFVVLAAACTNEPGASKPVAVTLQIDTNLTPGRDLDEFQLTVHQKGHDPDTRPYYFPKTQLPAYRPIIPGEEKRPYVTITLQGFLKGRELGKPLEAQFYIPEDYQEQLLKVPEVPKAGLQSLGLRTQAVDGLVPPAGGFRLDLLVDGLCSANVFTAECAEGETCIAGACRTSTVEITTLPVFGRDGEGSGTSPPKCHDVTACFENRTTMAVASDCKTVSPAPPGMTNVAVALEPRAGIGTCDAVECLLPLDYGGQRHGWTRAAEADGGVPLGTDGTIQLDAKLCETASSDGLQGFRRFVVSGDCPTFAGSVAPCPSEAPADGGKAVTPDGGTDGGTDGGEATTNFIVTGVLPADKATGVEPDTTIRVGFSMPLHAGNTGDVLAVLQDGVPIKGTVDVDGSDLVFHPSQPMALRTAYDVTAVSGIVAANGTTLGRPYTSKFTTRDGRWGPAASVSGGPAARPQVVIGPNGFTLVVFEVVGQLQSARWTPALPEWTPVRFLGMGFNVEGGFLLRSEPGWGAMTVARDGVLATIASSRFQWTEKDWEAPAAIDSSGGPDPFDALVHGGQGWAIYPESKGPRLGNHGAAGSAISVFPADMQAASISADALGEVTVVYAAPAPAGAGAIVSEQIVASPGKPGAAAEIARASGGMEIKSLRAVGDGTGVLNAFWIQQNGSGERISRVMASRRESGAWSSPREVYGTTGAFLSELHVAANSREEAVLTWLVDDLTAGLQLHGASATRNSSAVATKFDAELASNTAAPKTAIDPSGNGAVVWLNTATVSGVRTVRAARLAADGSWSTVEDLPGSSDAERDNAPDVAFDVDGRGWSVWSSASGVQVSRFE